MSRMVATRDEPPAAIGLVANSARILPPGASLILYGPWLKGVRGVEEFAPTASKHGFKPEEIRAMRGRTICCFCFVHNGSIDNHGRGSLVVFSSNERLAQKRSPFSTIEGPALGRSGMARPSDFGRPSGSLGAWGAHRDDGIGRKGRQTLFLPQRVASPRASGLDRGPIGRDCVRSPAQGGCGSSPHQETGPANARYRSLSPARFQSRRNAEGADWNQALGDQAKARIFSCCARSHSTNSGNGSFRLKPIP